MTHEEDSIFIINPLEMKSLSLFLNVGFLKLVNYFVQIKCFNTKMYLLDYAPSSNNLCFIYLYIMLVFIFSHVYVQSDG